MFGPHRVSFLFVLSTLGGGQSGSGQPSRRVAAPSSEPYIPHLGPVGPVVSRASNSSHAFKNVQSACSTTMLSLLSWRCTNLLGSATPIAGPDIVPL